MEKRSQLNTLGMVLGLGMVSADALSSNLEIPQAEINQLATDKFIDALKAKTTEIILEQQDSNCSTAYGACSKPSEGPVLEPTFRPRDAKKIDEGESRQSYRTSFDRQQSYVQIDPEAERDFGVRYASFINGQALQELQTASINFYERDIPFTHYSGRDREAEKALHAELQSVETFAVVERSNPDIKKSEFELLGIDFYHDGEIHQLWVDPSRTLIPDGAHFYCRDRHNFTTEEMVRGLRRDLGLPIIPSSDEAVPTPPEKSKLFNNYNLFAHPSYSEGGLHAQETEYIGPRVEDPMAAVFERYYNFAMANDHAAVKALFPKEQKDYDSSRTWPTSKTTVSGYTWDSGTQSTTNTVQYQGDSIQADDLIFTGIEVEEKTQSSSSKEYIQTGIERRYERNWDYDEDDMWNDNEFEWVGAPIYESGPQRSFFRREKQVSYQLQAPVTFTKRNGTQIIKWADCELEFTLDEFSPEQEIDFGCQAATHGFQTVSPEISFEEAVDQLDSMLGFQE